MKHTRIYSALAVTSLLAPRAYADNSQKLETEKIPGAKPRNVIFILSDDHRYDFMGFLNAVPWLQTPTMDKLAAGGCYLQNAFVTTSLSSPSRASILTGLYSHEHTVVDNEAPVPEGLTYFPQYLQEAGYRTAFFGKWHMGDTDDRPQPGFDHWESFKGQGPYYAPILNIDGKRVSYGKDVYTTDLLTDHAMEFITEQQREGKPWFVYLSHKSVHSPFVASAKHKDMYKDMPIPYPESYDISKRPIPQLPSIQADGKALAAEDWYGKDMVPDWVKNQRESWHGVDYLYHGRLSFEEQYRKYCEAITSLDDSMGRLMEFLEQNGLAENTLVIYMGDNGFIWGEHGLIDKRNFYEESVRVPLLAYCPELIKGGTVVHEMVQNVDIGPTIMEAAGIRKAPQMRGESWLPLAEGEQIADWRKRIYYEYYWEYDFPQTPTTFGVRTDKYKYIRYQGVWDINEFYDLENDPHETHNLIHDPAMQPVIRQLTGDLFDWLDETGGMKIPLKRMVKTPFGNHRGKDMY